MTALKWVLRIGIWAWLAYWISQIFIGDLGASPALRLNHEIGEIVLILLTANILVGIATVFVKPSPRWLRFLIQQRRFVGVSLFLMLLFHIGFYFLNEGFEGKAFVQVVTKTYLIFGFIASLILMALAMTSNQFSVRGMGGKNWKHLQRLVYLVQLLLFGHLLLIEKADVLKYSIWLGLLLILQVVRWLKVGLPKKKVF
jgi:sulfoxide reductase heme-binding subunit YedZ